MFLFDGMSMRVRAREMSVKIGIRIVYYTSACDYFSYWKQSFFLNGNSYEHKWSLMVAMAAKMMVFKS